MTHSGVAGVPRDAALATACGAAGVLPSASNSEMSVQEDRSTTSGAWRAGDRSFGVRGLLGRYGALSIRSTNFPLRAHLVHPYHPVLAAADQPQPTVPRREIEVDDGVSRILQFALELPASEQARTRRG